MKVCVNRLPFEYQEVEYIQSDGSSYTYIPSLTFTDNSYFEIKFENLATSVGYAAIAGVTTYANAPSMFMCTSANITNGYYFIGDKQ